MGAPVFLELVLTRTLTLTPERLTESAFAPYGVVLSGGLRPADFARPRLDLWRFGFNAQSPARLQIMRYHRQAMRFSQLERHVDVTEARFPIAGAQAVLVVADPTPMQDPAAAPAPESLRAFHLDGSDGVMLHKGAWHALDCFPLTGDHADFLFLSDEATETEIEAWGAPQAGLHTHVVDYSAAGIAFEIALPDPV